MKVKIWILGLALCACSVYAKPSGVFISGIVGADLNSSKQEIAYSGAQYTKDINGVFQADNAIISGSASSSDSGGNLLYGLRLGYVFGQKEGLGAFRLYATFNAGNIAMGIGDDLNGFAKRNLYFMRAGITLDYVLSFSRKPNAWGIFVGLGYEYGFYTFANKIKNLEKSSTHIPYVNLGLLKAFNEGHFSLEFGARIPLLSFYFKDRKSTNGEYYSNEYVKVNGDIAKMITTRTDFQLYAAINYIF